MQDLSFKDDIRIDQDRLDVEWLRQADLVYEYGEALAEAKDYTRRCHQKVKLTRSELVLKAKKGLAEDIIGVKKPSDSVCEAYYRTHPDYVEAVEDQLQAQKEEDQLQQAMFAIQSRRTSLEHLVRLLQQEYFTGPVDSHDLSSFDYDDFPAAVSDFVEKTKKSREDAHEKTTQRMVEKSPRRRRRR